MKTYRKVLTAIVALVAMTVGAMASPTYYAILHAMEEESMEVFTAGGEGSISVSKDGGETYDPITRFRFDRHGRGFARVYQLNRVPSDTPIKVKAAFNEGANGQPVDTIIKTTAGEFLDTLSPYKRWSWLAYAPIYVSYEQRLDIVDTAIDNGSFNYLVAAVQTAGLEEALRGEGPFTVFAPTDAAFEALAAALEVEVTDLLELPNLFDVLLYHVIGEALDGDAVAAATHLETLLGQDVEVEVIGEKIYINGAEVLLGDVEASNGVIHVIDAVLLPPELPNIYEIASTSPDFEYLTAALDAAGLGAALTNAGPYTVFAPTDDAFEALAAALEVEVADLLALPNLADILLYHVAEGRLKADDVVALERIATLLGKDVKVMVTDEGVFINDSLVVIPNIAADNGIIHVIDAVLLPPELPNIVEVAEDAGSFNTLLFALGETGLDEVLKGDGPYTVFAPTDEAFAKLPSWLLNYLVKNPNVLKQILLYHVVADDLVAEDVLAAKRIQTASGKSVYPKVRGDHAYINNAKIIATDIEASNGTVHVIDRVLIPWFRY